jgi:uncharacterized membrane protein (DUF4010 family)
MELDLEVLQNFAIAILIGVFIGIERERHQRVEHERTIGGLRTFILFALVGAVAGWLTLAFDTPWILVSVVLGVAAIVIAGYRATANVSPESLGVTTEIAAVATTLLGALTMVGFRPVAIALGVVVAAVLAYKEPMHGLVDKLGRDDVFAGIRLLIATFIVLPLLPDRTVDPWGALNPSSIWKLVLLIAGLSLIGYVATRLLGAKRGIALTGITGGLVSSTAITLTFARQSKDAAYRKMPAALATGVVLAWTIMFARVLIEVLVVNRSLLPSVVWPIAAMMATGACGAWWLHRQTGDDGSTSAKEVELKNPFSLTSAAKFAGFFALVQLVVKLAETYWPATGMYAVAALAGTTDVDAITLSMAKYAQTGDRDIAVNSIVIAALVNTLVKAGMVAVLGSSQLRKRILSVTAAIVAAGVIVIVL